MWVLVVVLLVVLIVLIVIVVIIIIFITTMVVRNMERIMKFWFTDWIIITVPVVKVTIQITWIIIKCINNNNSSITPPTPSYNNNKNYYKWIVVVIPLILWQPVMKSLLPIPCYNYWEIQETYHPFPSIIIIITIIIIFKITTLTHPKTNSIRNIYYIDCPCMIWIRVGISPRSTWITTTTTVVVAPRAAI